MRFSAGTRTSSKMSSAVSADRSEEHTSELRHVAISYAVFCLKKKKKEGRPSGVPGGDEIRTMGVRRRRRRVRGESGPSQTPRQLCTELQAAHGHKIGEGLNSFI